MVVLCHFYGSDMIMDKSEHTNYFLDESIGLVWADAY